MMVSGEINFNDVMYSKDEEAYYKLGFVMFVLFSLCMTVLTTNVLIGMRAFGNFIVFFFI